MTNSAPLNIALIGFGTVGSGVARILSTQAESIAIRAGRPIRIRRVVVRDPSKTREYLPDDVEISTDIAGVVNDPDIHLVAQLVGGIDPAYDYMTRFLKAGKDVVTANKALIYAHGAELFQQAADLGRTISCLLYTSPSPRD